MKKFATILICCLLLTSCSKEDNSEMEFTNLTMSQKTYVLNASPAPPECPPSDYNTPQTDDVQIAFSEPLENMMTLHFKVEINTGAGYSEQPGIVITADAGDTNAIVPTSCHLPMRVECGEYTEVKSETFRISLLTETAYEPEFDQYYYISAYRYCLGGGWNPGGPGGL